MKPDQKPTCPKCGGSHDTGDWKRNTLFLGDSLKDQHKGVRVLRCSCGWSDE